jgi:energy-coupling factor transporter ATP-binding protein EcfA2
MSQLDQAKKEAKRLFELAKFHQKNQSSIENIPYLPIQNLSQSREILSSINGYKNWHEYEKNLNKKDFIFNQNDKTSIHKEQQEIFQNQRYYNQKIDFHTIFNIQQHQTSLIVEKEHQPIFIGTIEKSTFLKSEKQWLLHQYPMLITGSAGAGKTETLLAMVSQYLQNQEGVIYLDGKGDTSVYVKIFSHAKKYNRLQDLYCLNFMSSASELSHNTSHSLTTNSIDPINPMLGNQDYFQHFFGRLGIVIHAILQEIHLKGQLMDIHSLESILILNNLISWNQEKKFETPEIQKYLTEIGWSSESEYDFHHILLNHTTQAHQSYKTIQLFKKYSHVFKLTGNVSMEKIFLERKILVISLNPFAVQESKTLGELITYQIQWIDEKYQTSFIHFQNIIIDEFHYFSNCFQNTNFQKSKNNYIFSSSSYRHINDIFHHILISAQTHLIMHLDDLLPEFIQLNLLHLNQLPKLQKNYSSSFIQNFTFTLKNLYEGQAYILSKNTKKYNPSIFPKIFNHDIKYYCEPITCVYVPTKYEKSLWIVNHPEPIFDLKEINH